MSGTRVYKPGERAVRLTTPMTVGEDVRWLQGTLEIDADGKFGKATDSAVRVFQRGQNLNADGWVGSATWAKLLGKDATKDPGLTALAAANRIITPDLIRACFPKAKATPEQWASGLTNAWRRYPNFNVRGVACILAKANKESGGLTRWDENLYYTGLEHMIGVFGRARLGPSPESLLRNPVALGNQVYGSWGGYAARGMGLIQNTTLENHQRMADDMGVPLHEVREYMLTIEGACMTPFWYLNEFNAEDKANAGDMWEVLRIVAGKASRQMLDIICPKIDCAGQVADYSRFLRLLGG